MSAPIALSVTVPDEAVAWELAQFCKRLSFSDALELTEAHLPHEERKEKAYQMIAGINALQRALADVGFDPR